MAMGLRPLDVSRWIEVDEHRQSELDLKRELLADHYDVVVATDPLALSASVELLDEVHLWLRTFRPDVELGPALAHDHPVVAAARLVQEDLCVLVHSDTWRLGAACVCFPSRWDLSSKIGRALDEIHGPVPLYEEHLSGPTNSLFDRLSAQRSFWRLNWTLVDSPQLHQPTVVQRGHQGDLDQWYFRVERQTLRRLERSGAVVFTIRSYVASVRELCDRYADFASSLLHSLVTAPEVIQEYKGWRGLAERLRSSLLVP